MQGLRYLYALQKALSRGIQKLLGKYLRKDLQLDCDVENEQHFGKYVVCHKCGSGDVVGCGFNRFMCADCGAMMSYDQSDYKEIMSDEYLEIDEKELSKNLKR